MNTSTNSAKAWAPDVQAFAAEEVLPGLLINEITTVAGVVEGDEVSLRLPVVTDVDSEYVAEGDAFTEQDADLSEVVVHTHKVGSLVIVSNELDRNGAAGMLSTGLARSVVNKSNAALLGNTANPTGLLLDAAAQDGGSLGGNLDTLSAAVWGIAAAGGQADYILAAPSAMADLAALKAGTGSNVPLVTEPVLYGLPVHVTTAMPADTILVGSRSAVVSAMGQVRLAKSADYAFNRDAVALRIDFRSGWTVTNGDRLVKISTA